MTTAADAGRDFAEMIRAATLAAIRRTEARSPATAAHGRRNLDDITQAAALDVLERIAAGADDPPAQLAHRAANAALMRSYRQTRHEAPQPAQEDDDAPPLPEPSTTGRGPEEAAEAAETIKIIVAAMPAAYREDAPQVLKAAAEGYTAAEIARYTGQQPRRVQRIIKAARYAGYGDPTA